MAIDAEFDREIALHVARSNRKSRADRGVTLAEVHPGWCTKCRSGKHADCSIERTLGHGLKVACTCKCPKGETTGSEVKR